MAIINIYENNSGALEGASAFGSENELRLTRTNDAVIKPGRVVTRDGHDRKVKVPTTAAEVLAALGVTELTYTQKLDANGDYPVNTRLVICRKAVMWMVAVTAAVQGQPVYCYYGSGDATLRGKVGGSFVSGQNAHLPGAKFATSQATPGSLVAVEFDLPGDAAAAAFGTNGYVDVVVDLAALSAGVNAITTAVPGALVGDVFVVTSLTQAIATAAIIAGNARCRSAGDVTWDIYTTGTPNPAENTFRFSLVSRQ